MTHNELKQFLQGTGKDKLATISTESLWMLVEEHEQLRADLLKAVDDAPAQLGLWLEEAKQSANDLKREVQALASAVEKTREALNTCGDKKRMASLAWMAD